MPYDPFKHRRRSIRLRDYDYSQAGAYFVTIVVRNPKLSLGNIVDGEMRLNEFGAIVQSCWDDLPAHYPNVELDAFVVMPNHVHGVIVLVSDFAGDVVVGGVVGAGLRPAPTRPAPMEPTKRHSFGNCPRHQIIFGATHQRITWYARHAGLAEKLF